MGYLTNEVANYLGDEMSKVVYVDNLPKKAGIAVFSVSAENYYQSEVSEFVLLVKIRTKKTNVDADYLVAETARDTLQKKTGAELSLANYEVAVIRCGEIVKDLSELDDYYDLTFPATLKIKRK